MDADDASLPPASAPQSPEAEASEAPPSLNDDDRDAAAAPPDPPLQEDAAADGEGGGGGDDGDEDDDEKLFSRVQRLMGQITSSQDNPNPLALHTLASLLEIEETRYMEKTGHSSLNNGRASHNVGRLANLLRENDEFFDLISMRFLSETRYTISVQAAAARLLLSCLVTGVYPHVFEETFLENIKNWVMDETFGENQDLKHSSEDEKSSDSEMLKTYATGLLAVCLAGGGPAVESALTSGLTTKLMRYLRSCVSGETSINWKDATYQADRKSTSGVTSIRGKEDGRSRARHVFEIANLDGSRIIGEDPIGDQNVDRDHERRIERGSHGDECWLDGGSQLDDDTYDSNADGGDRWHAQDGKAKVVDFDENLRDDSRRRLRQGFVRSRGKGQANEGSMENEVALGFSGSRSRLHQAPIVKDSLVKNVDVKKIADVRRSSGRGINSATEREDIDERFQEFKVGYQDISDVIEEAVRAAEAEARAAGAPEEAIKAAGDAAAEVVKSAALEEFQTTNDEKAALLAASRAASTVIDAGAAVEVSRTSNCMIADSMNSNAMELETEEAEGFFLPDGNSIAQLKQKYCIQCLEILGEYVEILGPVLNEKGVEVCFGLLQRSSKYEEAPTAAMLLPDVLKLVCALAAHRKFAALFMDRGGMKRLLAVPRVAHTFFGLSSCLFTIGSNQGVMERVCALPSEIIQQVVELTIQLLICPDDQARKNAALFFAAAFVFRAVIDSFDAQDGLQTFLSLLHDAASVRSGVTSGAVRLPTPGSLRNDRSPTEGLSTSEKQIAFHTCVALRNYFRAHLLLLVDFIRPSKNSRGAYRNLPVVKAAYEPLDITDEAIDAILLQLQKDRKLGPAFVRARWSPVDKFLTSNGHVTMLELCQAPSVERYLRDLLQYALGILHIVTLVPYSRKLIVTATLSNGRTGIAVILDAANCASYADSEIIQPALNVLVNLVCPPPSISNKPPPVAQGQQSSVQSSSIPTAENRDRNVPDRLVSFSSLSDARERNAESSLADRGNTLLGQQSCTSNSQTPAPTVTSGLVGDRRIYLGVGSGCAGLSTGLSTQLEQGYRQARDAVRANNGIKALLHLLQIRIASPPASLDTLRALACKVLLGLARDDNIAHNLTKLQVGKRLSEIIRDSGNQRAGTDRGRGPTELAQVAIELIGVVTNSGRASTLVASDATTTALMRIEKAAIAAATPITYHPNELLLLMHEHLQASGLAATAATLLKEAHITPLPSLAAPSSLAHQAFVQETSSLPIIWPSGRTPRGFLANKSKMVMQDDGSNSVKFDAAAVSSKKKQLVFSSGHPFQSKNQSQSHDFNPPSSGKVFGSSHKFTSPACLPDVLSVSPLPRTNLDWESQCKTPIILPMKRKQMESKETGSSSLKRLNTGEQGFRTPNCPVPLTLRRSTVPDDMVGSTPISAPRELLGRSTPSIGLTDALEENQCGSTNAFQMTPSSQPNLLNDAPLASTERMTLDSIIMQYLKHQHRQCPAPITTLPALSLMHPHVCPEPRRSLDAPSNITSRLSARECRSMYGGMHGHRRDRKLVYSRFRPWRTCRDDGALLTCLAFLGNSSQIAVGCHSGELKIFNCESNSVLESCTSHQSPLTVVQSYLAGDNQLILSSSTNDVRLWNASSVSAGPMHAFQGCKSARFSYSGNIFAALPSDQARREVFLYDIQTLHLESVLADTSPSSAALGRGHAYSRVHFSPSDTMMLWNGVLWDRRSSGPVHRFDQFTDYGGGGFHPAGNEVIINSEVWDLRKFRLLRSVPSLDQTTITFNDSGDVIYAILRRNLEDVTSAVHTRRVKHPLFAAFRTVDGISYSDIATTCVDRCVLDFASEPTDSLVGLVTMDDQEDMFSSARIYEVGRRRPTNDDSDPEDVESDDEEEDEDEGDGDSILGFDVDIESDADMSNGDSIDSDIDADDDDDDVEGGNRILHILAGSDEDDDSEMVGSLSSGDEDDFAF